MDRPVVSETDLKMMERCIELSKTVRRYGEFPFASLVCNGEVVVSEAINHVDRDADVTRHAELMAMSEAQRVLGRNDLSDCAIYSNVEPCAMCSFPIRETRISKVVFAIRSPLMGGFSKFDILQDTEMSEVMPEFFDDPPEIIGGVLIDDAERSGVTSIRLSGRSSDIAAVLVATQPRTGCIGTAPLALAASTGARLRT